MIAGFIGGSGSGNCLCPAPTDRKGMSMGLSLSTKCDADVRHEHATKSRQTRQTTFMNSVLNARLLASARLIHASVACASDAATVEHIQHRSGR